MSTLSLAHVAMSWKFNPDRLITTPKTTKVRSSHQLLQFIWLSTELNVELVIRAFALVAGSNHITLAKIVQSSKGMQKHASVDSVVLSWRISKRKLREKIHLRTFVSDRNALT